MLPDLTTKEGKKSLESKKRKAEQLTKQQQRLEDRVERERQKAADRLKSTAQREADRIEREQRKRADAARTEEVKAEKVRRLAAPCTFVFERCLCVARRCLVRGARAHAHHPPRK
jgi:cell division septum initiation protein DivIVA